MTKTTMKCEYPVGYDIEDENNKPDVDPKSLVYKATALSDELLCPICQCPFIEPYLTKCGHTFCKECLEKSLNSTSNKCPIDRTILNPRNNNHVFPAPIIISNLISTLTCECLNKTRGCSYEGPKWSIEAHVHECKFTRIKKEEGELIERRFIKLDLQNDHSNDEENDENDEENEIENENENESESQNEHDTENDLYAEIKKLNSKINQLETNENESKRLFSRLLNSISSGKTSIINSTTRDGLQSPQTQLETSNELMQNNEDEQDNIHLMIENERMRQEIDRLTTVVGELERSQRVLPIVLQDTSRNQDELQGMRLMINSLRQQFNFLMLERRAGMSMMNPNFANGYNIFGGLNPSMNPNMDEMGNNINGTGVFFPFPPPRGSGSNDRQDVKL